MPAQRPQTRRSSISVSAEIFVVPRSQIAAAWLEIERCISRVEHRDWTVEDVRKELEAGRAQAWGLRDESVLGFWITRIENTYSHKFGLVWIVAGDGLHEGLPFYRKYIEPWFWEQGCEWIELNGRKGWKRVLEDYEERAVVLVKRR